MHIPKTKRDKQIGTQGEFQGNYLVGRDSDGSLRAIRHASKLIAEEPNRICVSSAHPQGWAVPPRPPIQIRRVGPFRRVGAIRRVGHSVGPFRRVGPIRRVGAKSDVLRQIVSPFRPVRGSSKHSSKRPDVTCLGWPEKAAQDTFQLPFSFRPGARRDYRYPQIPPWVIARAQRSQKNLSPSPCGPPSR